MIRIPFIKKALLKPECILCLIILILCPINAYCKNTQLPKGYLILESLETYEISKFGAISTSQEAENIFSNITYEKIGISYLPLYFSDKDIDVSMKIARIAKKDNIDLWASSFKLVERIRAFGDIKTEYQAYVMSEDGSIVPAFIENKPLFDVLSKDAMTWFLKNYKEKYLLKMKGLIKGYLFDEDVLPYLESNKTNKNNNQRFNYWHNPTYSIAVLKEWQEYCLAHNVIYNNKIVDKFPVHKLEMVKNGKGMTEYYPGFNIPEIITAGQNFIDIPKSEGVWKYWYDFISELFINNWLGRIAGLVNEINKDNSEWAGVLYLGFHTWSLPYEEIKDPYFTVPDKHKWGAWGRQRGLDLEMLSKQPEIDYIVCETFPPIEANLDLFIAEYKRIVESGGKIFGLMLHRDDKWKMDLKEESRRWQLIEKYKPRILVRYPLKSILKENPYYSNEAEQYFSEQLTRYRNTPFKSSH